MMKDLARANYADKNLNCAVSVYQAACETLGIPCDPAEVEALCGFGGGMGCGLTCGALAASVAVIGRLYGKDDAYRPFEKCAGLVEAFRAKLGDINCTALKEKRWTEQARCTATVELAAQLLEDYLNKLAGNGPDLTADAGIPAEEIKRVKGLGFLQHKKTGLFNGRIITRNGRISAEECAAISAAAQKYGDGYMMMTTRLTVEVSGIPFEKIDDFRAEIGKVGLETGGTGSKVRPVVCCKSTTCQYGLYDAYSLAETIHERFYHGYHEVSLPHKFKIALGGCPNNCVKPNLNDLGIIGQRVPQFDSDACHGCKTCAVEAGCPIGAAKLQAGKLTIDPEACNGCGRCIGKCPFHCNDEGAYGWRIYVGGRWGKKVAHGQMLGKLFTSEAELLDTVEKAILLFREQGKSGERFADTIARLGFENVERQLLSNDLLERKNEILGLNVTGGATC